MTLFSLVNISHFKILANVMNKLFTIDTVDTVLTFSMFKKITNFVKGIAGLFQEQSFSGKLWETRKIASLTK